MKYRILTETKIVDGHTLYRIQRISNDALGGWIESEDNLSQAGDCWVADEACVYGDAYVSGSARISDNAQVYDSARIRDSALVCGRAQVYGYAQVCDSARVMGRAQISGYAHVSDLSRVFNSAHVFGAALIYHTAKIYDSARVYGTARVFHTAEVFDSAEVYDAARVYDSARVFGSAIVCGHVQLRFGKFTSDCRVNHAAVIRCGVAQIPIVDGKITLYKRVKSTKNPNVWTSCWDSNFKYYKGRARTVKNPNMDWEQSCASGLHLSHADYWNEGNALIACEVELNDIICVQDGKVRCKRIAKVLGEAL